MDWNIVDINFEQSSILDFPIIEKLKKLFKKKKSRPCCEKCTKRIQEVLKKKEPADKYLWSYFCSFECYKQLLIELDNESGKRYCIMDNCQKECAKKDDGQYYDYCSRGHAYQHKTLMQPKWEKKPANTEPWKSSYYLKHHDDRQILFYDKFQPYYDFTNFAPYPIVVERVIYPTSEHYFQAQKLIGTQHFHQILTNPSPRYAFEYARQEHVKPWIRKDWQEIKNNVMYKALYHKFTQYSTLATMLLQTGDKELIEDSPYDSYWGCGRDKQGMNVLGKLLMKLRKILAAASMEVPHMHVAQIIAFDSHSTESSSVTQAASMGVAQTIDSHSTESSSNVNQAASMGVPCVAQTHSTESSPNVTQKNNVQTETETDHDDNSSSQIMAPSTDANATSESNVQSGDSNSSSQIMAPSTDANATSESNVQSGDGNSSSQIMAPSTDANATPESNVRSGDGNSSSQDTEESNKHVETGNGNSSAVTALHLTDTNATQQVNVQTSDGNPSTEASQARITDNNQNANSQTTFLDLQLLDGMDQGHSGNENVSTTSQDKALCTYQESNTSIPNPDGSEATSPSTYSEENMETNENETSSSDMETN